MDRNPQGPSASLRWIASSLIAIGFALGTASCSSDGAADVSAATLGTTAKTLTTIAPTSTTTIEDVEAEVRAAYLKAESSYYEVLKNPDPGDLRLGLSRMGKNLRSIRSYVKELADQGQAVRYPRGVPLPEVRSITVASNSSSAEVVSCVLDRSEVYDVASGEVVDDDSAVWVQRYKLELHGDRWMVQDGQLLDDGGVQGC